MKNNTPLRKLLILAILVVGFVVVGFDAGNQASAADNSDSTRFNRGTQVLPNAQGTPKSCSELFYEYEQANNDYYNAGLSHIQGSPTTCATDCIGKTNPNCEADCKSQRGFAYYNAEYKLFGAANASCRPETIEFCPEAQQKANQCQASYGNYASFEDEEYGNMVYNQYTACRLESKIDTCY